MESFEHGGGVPFTDFGIDIVQAIERLFQAGYETWVAQQWIPAVPGVHERLTAGGEAAEVRCGAGQCLIPVARAYPERDFFGYDADMTSIERALGSVQATSCAAKCPDDRIIGLRHSLTALLSHGYLSYARSRV